MRMSLRQIERYLTLASEIKGLEALDDSLLAIYPHLTQEGREDLKRLWRERARVETEAPLSQNAGPVVSWSQMRAFVGAPPKS